MKNNYSVREALNGALEIVKPFTTIAYTTIPKALSVREHRALVLEKYKKAKDTKEHITLFRVSDKYSLKGIYQKEIDEHTVPGPHWTPSSSVGYVLGATEVENRIWLATSPTINKLEGRGDLVSVYARELVTALASGYTPRPPAPYENYRSYREADNLAPVMVLTPPTSPKFNKSSIEEITIAMDHHNRSIDLRLLSMELTPMERILSSYYFHIENFPVRAIKALRKTILNLTKSGISIQQLSDIVEDLGLLFFDLINAFSLSKLIDVFKGINSAQLSELLDHISAVQLSELLNDYDGLDVASLSDYLDTGLNPSLLSDLFEGICAGNIVYLLGEFSTSQLSKLAEDLGVTRLAELIESLGVEELPKIFKSISPSQMSELLDHINSKQLAELLNEGLEPSDISYMLEYISADKIPNLINIIGTGDKLSELLCIIKKYNPSELLNDLATSELDCFVLRHSGNKEVVSFMIDNYDIDTDWVRSEIGSLSSGRNLAELFAFERIVDGEEFGLDDVESLGCHLDGLAI